MFNLGEAILALLEIVFGFWNNQVSLVFELLGQSPTGFKGGGPWGIIEGIEPLFVGIGSALVVLFFVIAFFINGSFSQGLTDILMRGLFIPTKIYQRITITRYGFPGFLKQSLDLGKVLDKNGT
jgi:hypothetical protein